MASPRGRRARPPMCAAGVPAVSPSPIQPCWLRACRNVASSRRACGDSQGGEPGFREERPRPSWVICRGKQAAVQHGLHGGRDLRLAPPLAAAPGAEEEPVGDQRVLAKVAAELAPQQLALGGGERGRGGFGGAHRGHIGRFGDRLTRTRADPPVCEPARRAPCGSHLGRRSTSHQYLTRWLTLTGQYRPTTLLLPPALPPGPV